jgi:hypothetical protein
VEIKEGVNIQIVGQAMVNQRRKQPLKARKRSTNNKNLKAH